MRITTWLLVTFLIVIDRYDFKFNGLNVVALYVIFFIFYWKRKFKLTSSIAYA